MLYNPRAENIRSVCNTCMRVYTLLLPYLKADSRPSDMLWRALMRDDIPPIDASRISVTYVLYLRRGARSLCWPYISDERTEYRAPSPFVVSVPLPSRASISLGVRPPFPLEAVRTIGVRAGEVAPAVDGQAAGRWKCR